MRAYYINQYQYLIQTVQEFNKDGQKRYLEAVEDYHPVCGGFPFIGSYCFFNEDNEFLSVGYVVTTVNEVGKPFSKKYFKTKKEAESYVFNNVN